MKRVNSETLQNGSIMIYLLWTKNPGSKRWGQEEEPLTDHEAAYDAMMAMVKEGRDARVSCHPSRYAKGTVVLQSESLVD